MQLLIGSRNPGKAVEIREALSGIPLDFILPDDIAAEIDDPEETGSTFAENALLKARHFHRAAGLPTIADDSGIVVDALKNELGIHTRRWGAGAGATDEEWIAYFLQRMEREENRKAKFICTIAFIDDRQREHIFEGVCDGTITKGLEASYLPGLPISACFRPEGFDLVYSAMSIDEKNTVSHRGKAVRLLRKHLIIP
ncbi:non-canonical purine NTP pyrophosphatase [Candidatus Peregrinibacteria bacterium]|nr:non-canonical purine NTP pyrophosphatase [Candidatus Peregrinibacteria bacterium]